MYKDQSSIFIRVISIFLVLVIICSLGVEVTAQEILQPRASDYLSSYSSYVYLPGNGEVRVYFSVSGTNYMDELGALSIAIYESTDGVNWSWKKTFTHDSTAGMLSYNDDYHSGYVSCNGIVGRYYRAYVCIWGGKDGDGDTRYFWTSVKH